MARSYLKHKPALPCPPTILLETSCRSCANDAMHICARRKEFLCYYVPFSPVTVLQTLRDYPKKELDSFCLIVLPLLVLDLKRLCCTIWPATHPCLISRSKIEDRLPLHSLHFIKRPPLSYFTLLPSPFYLHASSSLASFTYTHTTLIHQPPSLLTGNWFATPFHSHFTTLV